jgi:hypothetical protein
MPAGVLRVDPVPKVPGSRQTVQARVNLSGRSRRP